LQTADPNDRSSSGDEVQVYNYGDNSNAGRRSVPGRNNAGDFAPNMQERDLEIIRLPISSPAEPDSAPSFLERVPPALGTTDVDPGAAVHGHEPQHSHHATPPPDSEFDQEDDGDDVFEILPNDESVPPVPLTSDGADNSSPVTIGNVPTNALSTNQSVLPVFRRFSQPSRNNMSRGVVPPYSYSQVPPLSCHHNNHGRDYFGYNYGHRPNGYIQGVSGGPNAYPYVHSSIPPYPYAQQQFAVTRAPSFSSRYNPIPPPFLSSGHSSCIHHTNNHNAAFSAGPIPSLPFPFRFDPRNAASVTGPRINAHVFYPPNPQTQIPNYPNFMPPDYTCPPARCECHHAYVCNPNLFEVPSVYGPARATTSEPDTDSTSTTSATVSTSISHTTGSPARSESPTIRMHPYPKVTVKGVTLVRAPNAPLRCLWRGENDQICNVDITNVLTTGDVQNHFHLHEVKPLPDSKSAVCRWGDCGQTLNLKYMKVHVARNHFRIREQCSHCGNLYVSLRPHVTSRCNLVPCFVFPGVVL
jgi:hypothetical protein